MDLIAGEVPFKKSQVTKAKMISARVQFLWPLPTFLFEAGLVGLLTGGNAGALTIVGGGCQRAGLVQRSASRTAMMVALIRYIGSKEGWTTDYLAKYFLPWDMIAFINCTKLCTTYPLSLRRFGWFMARTIAGDRLIERSSVKQVVMLGAGLDTRAHRLKLPEGCKFFEIDIATTQAMKKKIAAKHPKDFVNKDIHYIPVDFSSESFVNKLFMDKDFDHTCSDTVVIFEGVSMYLRWEALKETLEMISKSFAEGTIVGMDCFDDFYTTPQARKRPIGSRSLKNIVKIAGEPFVWGIPEGQTANDIFPKLGFELCVDLDKKLTEETFLTLEGNTKSTFASPSYWHYVVLKVKKPSE